MRAIVNKEYGSPNILFTAELARPLKETRVTVNALHPGFVAAGFAKNNSVQWTGFASLRSARQPLAPSR